MVVELLPIMLKVEFTIRLKSKMANFFHIEFYLATESSWRRYFIGADNYVVYIHIAYFVLFCYVVLSFPDLVSCF